MGKNKTNSALEVARRKMEDHIPGELRNAVHAIQENLLAPLGSRVAPECTTVVDTERRYLEVSDSFCQLVGYEREELIGKKYDDLTAPGTNDIPTVFCLFAEQGYMHGLWVLVHRSGTQILIRYESWVRPDCSIKSNMEVVGVGYCPLSLSGATR
jgi:PAS domain S-box-containing protein